MWKENVYIGKVRFCDYVCLLKVGFSGSGTCYLMVRWWWRRRRWRCDDDNNNNMVENDCGLIWVTISIFANGDWRKP